jgi:hypothetical protein
MKAGKPVMVEGAGSDLLYYNVAEASPCGWYDRWSTFFAPVDSNLVICVVDLPPDQHLAVRPGQRSMLRSIGREFVQI